MMSDFNAQLAAVSKELTTLLKGNTPPVAMTAAQLVTYTTEQLVLAKAEADPTERLAALSKVVELAKAYTWEDGATMEVPVYSGPLSVQAGSRQAEKISEHPGMGLGTGQQAAPDGIAFEAASGPSGPATNTASPTARYMPPALPQSSPEAAPEGWMAKAAALLKQHGQDALLAELTAMLAAEGAEPITPGAGQAAAPVAKNDDRWPSDLATPAFLEGKPAIDEADDFGADPVQA